MRGFDPRVAITLGATRPIREAVDCFCSLASGDTDASVILRHERDQHVRLGLRAFAALAAAIDVAVVSYVSNIHQCLTGLGPR